MFVTVDGTPQEIADLLFAVRNRQNSDDKKPDICSPLSTLEDSVKTAKNAFKISIDNEMLKQDIQKAIDDTLEEEPE